MRVTFLGTGGAVPTTERNTPAVHVQREGETFLFDCGEGTQRQMMRYGTGFSVSHLFVTHLHGDHVLGVPGLLQTMDFNDREAPLCLVVPRGRRRQIRALTEVAGTNPSFPLRIAEVSPGDVAYDADEFEVRAVEVDHRTRAVGYVLAEDDRKGRFDRERAEELGVPVGPKFSRLHEGNPVELDDGTVVRPDQVVGPPRPGRTFVYTGDTAPTDAVRAAAADADLLVHDATFAADEAERAAETGHSTAAQAGQLAARAGATRLALTHISSRYAGNVGGHLDEARGAYDGDVFVPSDGQTVEVPYPDDE